MLTKLIIRNFKRFDNVEIELGNPVVFIGPNNSGKTAALQALALWGLGLRRWIEKRKGQKTPEKRPGITINRQDLIALPVSTAKLLWRGLHVRNVQRSDEGQRTSNVLIDIVVEGFSGAETWLCGLEFDYANEESFYCRPLRLPDEGDSGRMPVPDGLQGIKFAFLPPMSGLAANETRIDEGAINVRIGEGRTAEVLRNLCYKVYADKKEHWERLLAQMDRLFGCQLDPPEYISERGEVKMTYRERGTQLDLSSSGRGLQQTLLLLAYVFANPGSVLLLDEPDAHLEMLRQRQTYQILADAAQENGNQIIVASHSEIILNEAAGKDMVVAFVGRPHRMLLERRDETLKSLREIGYEQYYLAEQNGWALYLEGETDLDILRAFARRLDHKEVLAVLERPFVHYTTDITAGVYRHFSPLKDAFPDLCAVALFDRHDKNPSDDGDLKWLMWSLREIESYLCYPETLLGYAESIARREALGELFAATEVQKLREAMQGEIDALVDAMKTLKRGSPWDGQMKVSDEFLTPLFENFFEKLGLYNDMPKRSFHELVQFVPVEKISDEIKENLDAIVEVARKARPLTEDD
ncbi:MAG: AAA family ATPase [Candidatus Coatesbacteria bacterium]|nr:AAA family ATPase [Candidatus Coatesbacteria bacterium]